MDVAYPYLGNRVLAAESRQLSAFLAVAIHGNFGKFHLLGFEQLLGRNAVGAKARGIQGDV